MSIQQETSKSELTEAMRRELETGKLEWFKASPSNTQGNQCVEAAFLKDGIAVRDSKDPNGPKLLFTKQEWKAFMAGAKNGEFDQE